MKSGSVVVFVALAVLAVACGSSDSGVDVDAARGQVGQNASAEQEYLTSLREGLYPVPSNLTDQQLIEMAYVQCSALDEGWTVENLFAALLNNGMDSGPATSIVMSSVYEICPRHERLVDEFVQQGS